MTRKRLEVKDHKYGWLVPREPTQYLGRLYWLCDCKRCKRKTRVRFQAADLVSGKVISCGCHHRSQLRKLRARESKAKLYLNLWKKLGTSAAVAELCKVSPQAVRQSVNRYKRKVKDAEPNPNRGRKKLRRTGRG